MMEVCAVIFLLYLGISPAIVSRGKESSNQFCIFGLGLWSGNTYYSYPITKIVSHLLVIPLLRSEIQ